MTILEKVRAYISATIDDATLLSLVKDALTETLRVYGGDTKYAFAQETEYTSFPITVTNPSILAVYRVMSEGDTERKIPCRYVPYGKLEEVLRSEHPEYPVEADPIYTISGNQLYIYPVPDKASIVTLVVPDVTNAEYIDKLPRELHQPLLWYSIAQAKMYEAKARNDDVVSRLADVLSDITAYLSERPSISAPTAPTLQTISLPQMDTLPTFPTLDFIDTSQTLDDNIALPTLTLPSAVDLSNYTVTLPVLVLPDMGALPDDLVFQGLNVSDSPPTMGTLPTFSFSETLTLPDTVQIDPFIVEDAPAVGTLTVPSPPTAPTLSDISITEFIISSTLPDTSSLPTLNLDFSNFTSYMGDDDFDKARVELEKIGAELNKYASDIRKQIEQYNTDINKYRSEVEKEATRIARSIDEYRSQLEKEVNEYRLALEKHRYDVEKAVNEYTFKLDREITEWRDKQQVRYQAYASKVNNEVQNYVAQVRANVDSYRSKFESAIGEYRERANVVINEYRAKLEEYINKYRLQIEEYARENDIDINMFRANLEKAIAEYREKVNAVIAEYREVANANIAQWRTEIESAISNYREQVQAAIGEYGAEVRAYIDRYVAVYRTYTDQVRINLEGWNSEYRNKVEKYVAEARNAIESVVATNRSLIDKYRADIEEYAQEYASALNNAKMRIDSIRSRFEMMNVEIGLIKLATDVAIMYEKKFYNGGMKQ